MGVLDIDFDKKSEAAIFPYIKLMESIEMVIVSILQDHDNTDIPLLARNDLYHIELICFDNATGSKREHVRIIIIHEFKKDYIREKIKDEIKTIEQWFPWETVKEAILF